MLDAGPWHSCADLRLSPFGNRKCKNGTEKRVEFVSCFLLNWIHHDFVYIFHLQRLHSLIKRRKESKFNLSLTDFPIPAWSLYLSSCNFLTQQPQSHHSPCHAMPFVSQSLSKLLEIELLIYANYANSISDVPHSRSGLVS
jgi:hypothetical protein